MPLYEFELCSDGQVVATVNVPLSVSLRDSVTLRRAELPKHLAVSLPKTEDTHQANDVLRAYKRIESRQGDTKEFRHKIGHSAKQVKAAWS